MANEIINKLLDLNNGLLSKIQIGGKTYEIKDQVARQEIETLIANAVLYQTKADAASEHEVINKAISDGDKAVKDYVDAQVGAINKFDVAVVEELPTPSAETMYVLYLKKVTGSTGEYVEYITVRHGEEGSYTYTMEQIGSTAMDLTGFVTEKALEDALEPYAKTADLGDLAGKNEAELNLGDLAHKDSASGTVAGQTISGVKASGTSTGSINVALSQGTETINSTGNYTPAGTVTGGKVVAAGSVAITVTNADAQATLATADYQPAGDVNVVPATTEIQVVKSKGTAASFVEGEFTAATLDKTDVTANYAKEGLVGAVEDECLTFTAAAIEAITATKVNSFTGGSKAADSWTANVPAEIETKTVATGIASSSFTGAVATGLKVTGVTYQKHDSASATFTGSEVDVTGASFSGDAATIEVAGNGKTYAIDTENTKFNGAAIELAVGDITVAAKDVTVQ